MSTPETDAPVVRLVDSTLRDGNHAVGHQLSRDNIRRYAAAAERARIEVLEVGHGNGLGASSLQVGRAALTDAEMLATAKDELSSTRLGVLSLPGFSVIDRDLKPALEAGVTEVRIGAHCTEANITQQQIEILQPLPVRVLGVLMMTHMATPAKLLEQALLMQGYGADGVVLMDSAGAATLPDVRAKVGTLVDGLEIEVGFHAHENLGLSVANALTAIDSVATIVDGTARGFGAGAGNAPTELLVANLHTLGIRCTADLYGTLDAAELAEAQFIRRIPASDAITISGGMAGVFSGFAPPVRRAAERFRVDARDLIFALGERRVIAGQEDVIVDVALELAEARRGRHEQAVVTAAAFD